MNKTIQDRIDRITKNLRPKTTLTGEFAAPTSLSDRMKHYHTPGVSIAVINNFEIEWARGFGVCDANSHQPVTADTMFQAASISKPIFALGVMRLVEEGKLNIDENIDRYLKTWQLPTKENWQPRITFRQILSHSAGLTVHGFPGYLTTELLPTVTQILNGEPPANTEKVEVDILPGLQSRYSGGGTTVAQQAIIDLLDLPFPQIMQELVLDRLELNDSTYEQPLPEHLKAQAATGHDAKGLPIAGKYYIYPEMAAAGLWTTPTDLAKIGVELLNIIHDLSSLNFLTRDTLNSMLCPQLAGEKIDDALFVGIGFYCNGKGDSFQFGHGGSNEGFLSLMRFYPNIGKGAVVMLNSNDGWALIPEILQAIATEYEWTDATHKDKIIVNLENIDLYIGIYLSLNGTKFEISIDGDRLLFHHGQQPPLPIFPSSATEFFSHAIDTIIGFQIEEQSTVISIIVSQADKQIEAIKQI